jgi:hypothetical protein
VPFWLDYTRDARFRACQIRVMVQRMAKGAGYSGTPLARKLGIVEDAAIIALDAPANYVKLLAPLPPGVSISPRLAKSPAFVHLFVTSRATLQERLRHLRGVIAQDGTVWVSWPKKSAKVATDITEDVIREVALPLGFVDVKVCAVDETWSGLKLMIRRELRGTRRM